MLSQHPNQRLIWIDALRGMAAVLVFASHTVVTLQGERYVDWAYSYINVGHLGVILFFLISGYIIPRSLRGGQMQFWLRRAFRLLPLYWLVLAYVALILTPWTDWYNVVINVAMLTTLIGAPAMVGVGWSLSVELVWYGLISVLVALRLDRRNVEVWIVLSTLVIVSEVFLPAMTGHHIPVVAIYLPVFWAGLLIERWQQEDISGQLAWGLYAVSLGLLVVLPGMVPGYTTARVLAFVIFAVVVQWGRHWHWPRWVIWTGERSYSIYLIHDYVLAFKLVAQPVTMVVVWWLTTFLLSELTWRIVESPSVTIGKSFKLDKNRPSL